MSKMGAHFIATEQERAEQNESMVQYLEYVVGELTKALKTLWEAHYRSRAGCLNADLIAGLEAIRFIDPEFRRDIR